MGWRKPSPSPSPPGWQQPPHPPVPCGTPMPLRMATHSGVLYGTLPSDSEFTGHPPGSPPNKVQNFTPSPWQHALLHSGGSPPSALPRTTWQPSAASSNAAHPHQQKPKHAYSANYNIPYGGPVSPSPCTGCVVPSTPLTPPQGGTHPRPLTTCWGKPWVVCPLSPHCHPFIPPTLGPLLSATEPQTHPNSI